MHLLFTFILFCCTFIGFVLFQDRPWSSSSMAASGSYAEKDSRLHEGAY